MTIDSVNIPANVVTDPPPGADVVTDPPPFRDSIPEAYREKTYLQDVDSIEKVYAKLDGSQQLLGKRPNGIPDKNATAEDWNAFYNNAGRPETADKYELEGFKEGQEELSTDIKALFHKVGLSGEQAKELQTGYDGIMTKLAEGLGASSEANEAEFREMTTKYFGDDQVKIIATANKLLMESIPADLKPHLEKLDNTSLVIMASALNNIQKRYIGEDRLSPRDDAGAGGGGETQAELQAAARKIMNQPGYEDSFHPDHAKLIAAKDAIYEKIGAMLKK